MSKLVTNFAGIEFKNPLVLASGTSGFGRELNQIFKIEQLGGISTKGLTLHQREGNTGIRLWETPSGLMNSIGLENPGVDGFIKLHLDWINDLDLVNIVNLSGHSIEDYLEGLRMLNNVELDILELNISCPNLKEGGMNFGVNTKYASQIIRQARDVCKHKMIVKLSPNAEDIVSLAKACEDEGADGISLVNTFLAAAIDINKGKLIFDNGYAGLSGPAIKPIALRMVHQVSKAVNIPIMGLGGISTWQDAIEFIMAGATILQIGTATFTDPKISLEILKGIETFLDTKGYNSIEEIRGIA